jgi:hypothetical protein
MAGNQDLWKELHDVASVMDNDNGRCAGGIDFLACLLNGHDFQRAWRIAEIR